MQILSLDISMFNPMRCAYNSKSEKLELVNATTDRVYLDTVFKKAKLVSHIPFDAGRPIDGISARFYHPRNPQLDR